MKKRLIDRIYDNLKQNKHAVTMDEFPDRSSRWIEIRKGDISITISFDSKGNDIEKINAYKDIVQVVDQEKLF